VSSAPSFLHAAWAAARRDWIRRWRDPLALAVWLGLPLVIGGLILLANGSRGGAAPRASVLVASHDQGFLADLLVQALSSERAGLIEAERVDEPDGRARLDRGEATALLVIPAGFSAAVWSETPTRLELVTNPSQRILPGLVEESVELLGELVFYAHRVLGDALRQASNAAFSGDELEVARAAVLAQRGLERIGPYVVPPALEVRASVRSAERPKRSLAAYFAPAMLLMALLFMAEGLADDVWRERQSGTLRRVVATPGGASASLAGKLVAGWALMLCVALVASGAAAVAFDCALWRAALGALWSSLVGAAFLALFSLVKLFAGTQRAASVLGNLLVFPLLMLGGSFVPFAAMPESLARIGRFTPNGWAVGLLDELLFGAFAPSTLALGAAGVLLTLLALAAACARRMNGAFARGAS